MTGSGQPKRYSLSSIGERRLFVNKETPAAHVPVPPPRLGQWRSYATAFAVGLLIAALPLAWLLVQTTRHRNDINRELRTTTLELSLVRAVVLARNGDYATARDEASAFFTSARTEVDRQSDSLDGAHTNALKKLLLDRDAIITLLARSDPASGERLSQLYLSYRSALTQP
jgi:hypothetical protein